MSNPFETPHDRCGWCGHGFYPRDMPDWAREGCGCPNPECSRARHSGSPVIEVPEPIPMPETYISEAMMEPQPLKTVRHVREMWTKGKMRQDMLRWWTWVEASR